MPGPSPVSKNVVAPRVFTFGPVVPGPVTTELKSSICWVARLMSTREKVPQVRNSGP